MRELTTAAKAAKMVREELKKTFPGIKFQVKSSNFAGGNAVDVFWKDGPKQSEVDKIIKKYQYGHFDGMTDSYEYSNTRSDIPQARFVHSSRHMSDEMSKKIDAGFKEKYGIDLNDETACYKMFFESSGLIRWREFQTGRYLENNE